MIEMLSYQLNATELVLVIVVAVLVGVGKTGVAGAGMIAVPVLAIVFGSKNSTGIMLPLLVIADLFAVAYYHKHADWRYLSKLLPYALAGIVVGTLLGEQIDETMFKLVMGGIIFTSLIIMVWQEHSAKLASQSADLGNNTPALLLSKQLTPAIGIVGGFTTMVGNLAGPIMSLYLLAMRLPKNVFIGTAAWFFMLINLIKVPFHVFVWETITLNSVLFTLTLTPAVALGAWLGVKLAALFSEQVFRWLVVSMTAVAALAMLA